MLDKFRLRQNKTSRFNDFLEMGLCMLNFNRVVLMGVVETDLKIKRIQYACGGYFVVKTYRHSCSSQYDYMPIVLNEYFCEKFAGRIKKRDFILIEGRVQQCYHLGNKNLNVAKKTAYLSFLEIYAQKIDLQ